MQTLADSNQVAAIIQRLADEVRAAMVPPGPWAFIGVRSRGDILANRLAQALKPDYLGTLDITLHRDDISGYGAQAIVQSTEMDFPIDGANVLLIDDVLATGRSTRAALQSIIDYGRPRCVRLLVLVDRGGRELPISPDFVGMRTVTGPNQLVEVHLMPTDAQDGVVVFDRVREEA